MRWIVALLLSTTCATATPYEITRVIDGDTVEIAVDFLPDPLPPKLSIRVMGIDTPEKAPRAQCDAEAALAKKASAFTKNAVANALAESLISAGLARPYKGEAKSSWCE